MWSIVQKLPNKPWNYNLLSTHETVTWDILSREFPSLHYGYIVQNPNITWDIIQNNLDKPWNYNLLSKNPNITWDIVQNNPEIPWHYGYMSLNPNITWRITQHNPEFAWNYTFLTRNFGVETLQYINVHNINHWDWQYLSSIVDYSYIRNHSQYPWNYGYVIKNPSVTWDILHNFILTKKPNDFNLISQNPNINMGIIMHNLNINWNYKYICASADLFIDDLYYLIQENLISESDAYFYYSRNKNLAWDYILENPDKNWDYKYLSMKPI